MIPRGSLIALRHGQSTTNAQGRFTGWLDVPLTEKGRAEAVTAGRLIAESELLPHAVHTSLLRRTVQTADIVLEEAGRPWVPVTRTWRLNERQALTGRDKSEVREEAGPERYETLRRSLHGKPEALPPGMLKTLYDDPRYAALRGNGIPGAESLSDMVERITPYWTEVLAPRMTAGLTVLMVAHGNSIRALLTLLDNLSAAEARNLNIPTGAPLYRHFDRGLRPLGSGWTYLDPDAASTAAAAVASEGHT
ncbi:2,3-bisphosphoglycerate-dependent phosphoglycerate mutase [Streptomyces sp. 8L]|uniref:2,3-bisphosphoglycerate-dependent phosphoglycerate mutase n=1 Tax=Streptomyces sp. 8L TaxID=2877242 RepID=UPI001CD3499A|nr:2,3-bisphosphoglycerate-dependent phosphoglycerate mutase [Streptomyces sp. 8L]MCA1218082.1 2,3-bisphosphoglycerate-dependent phosphoglycerate mutase [Streptomyces sp. 8L]